MLMMTCFQQYVTISPRLASSLVAGEKKSCREGSSLAKLRCFILFGDQDGIDHVNDTIVSHDICDDYLSVIDENLAVFDSD